MRATALVFRAVVAVVLLLPLPGFAGAVFIDVGREWREPPSSTREFAFARRHLRESFSGYGQMDVLVGQFGVVALSHFAAGLMNVYVAERDRRDEVLALLDETVRRAKSPLVAPSELVDDHPIDPSTALDDHNLYFSHLAVILGIRRLVGGNSADDKLQARLVSHLRAKTMESSLYHARSYPDSERWPADQSVTLLALRLYDEAAGTHLLDAPLAGFLATMRARTDHATGLFHSSVSPLDYATTPRGCATSWTTLYLAQVAPDVAREQYDHYRAHMSADVFGYGGFREWPVGRARGMDADSGPILFGVGVAATGLGLGPARLFADADRYATIRRSALTFGIPSWLPSHGYVTAPLLGEAILFHGRTARPWFGPALSAPVAKASFSWNALFGLIGYVALIGFFARRTWRLFRSS